MECYGKVPIPGTYVRNVLLRLAFATNLFWVMGVFNFNFLFAEWRNVNDIGKLLEIAVHLPLHSQKTILKRCGEAFTKLGEGHCNIFGGHSSCVTIPSDSDYVKVCPQAKKEVDCAFELAALEHITKDPESQLRERLSREGQLAIYLVGACM